MEIQNSISSVKGDLSVYRKYASLRFYFTAEDGQMLWPSRAEPCCRGRTSCGLGEVGESFTSLENMPRSFGTQGERTATAETSFTLGLNMPW